MSLCFQWDRPAARTVQKRKPLPQSKRKHPRRPRVVIDAKPLKGGLSNYGYSVELSDASRHAAIMRAVRAEGYDTIIGRLTLIANLNHFRSPWRASVFKKDQEWLSAKYRIVKGEARARSSSGMRAVSPSRGVRAASPPRVYGPARGMRSSSPKAVRATTKAVSPRRMTFDQAFFYGYDVSCSSSSSSSGSSTDIYW